MRIIVNWPGFFTPSPLRLKPFTSYQFRVKATNDIGDSEYSQESETITTLQDGKRRWAKHGGDLSNVRDDAVAVPLQQCFNFGFSQ